MQASRVLIFNRTASKAEQLATEFGEQFEACDLSGLEELPALHHIVDTLPGSSGFTLPPAAFKHKPNVLEASYIPRQTALVQQALAAGCEVVEGIEMLFEQGCSQVAIWTQQEPPRRDIARALLEALFGSDSEHPAHADMVPHDHKPKALLLEAEMR